MYTPWMLFSVRHIVGQKVKLQEHYFQSVYIETVASIGPVGSHHRSMKPLAH